MRLLLLLLALNIVCPIKAQIPLSKKTQPKIDTIEIIRSYKHIDSLMPEKLKSKVRLARQTFNRNIIVKNDKDVRSEKIALEAINKRFQGLTKKEIDLLVFYLLAGNIKAFHEKNYRLIVENPQKAREVKKPFEENNLAMIELQDLMQKSNQVSQFTANAIKSMNETVNGVISNICGKDCD